MLGFHIPVVLGLLPGRTKSSEPRLYRLCDYPSLLPLTGWLTAGRGLKTLRRIGRVPESLNYPLQSRTQCCVCSSCSLIHLGGIPRLGCLLPVKAQTKKHVEQVEPAQPTDYKAPCSQQWLPAHKAGKFPK
jgi:hypothetical protein